MDEADHRADNPYTALEGYEVRDASGEVVGEIEDTVYDAPSDVVVDGRPIPAEMIDVDADAQRVSVPRDRETIQTAPKMEDPSGEFDAVVRRHYEGRA